MPGPDFTALLLTVVDGIGVSRLPRLLNQAGCEVTLFAPARLLVGRTRFVRTRVGSSHDPAALSVEFRDYMQRLPQPFNLVIVGDELMLHELLRWSGESWLPRCLPMRDCPELWDIILSKHKLIAAARRAGLAVPRSIAVATWEEVSAAAEQIGLPLMLKKGAGFAGSGVRKAADSHDLRLAYEQLGGSDLAAEEFIEGPVGLTETLFYQGRPLAWVSSYKVKSWPTPLSPSCIRRVTTHPDVEALAKGVGAITGFTGFVGIDWVHDRTRDRLILIELNPRPTPGLHLGRRAGVDFAHVLRTVLEGNPIEQRPNPACDQTFWMFPQSIYSAIDDRRLGNILRAFADVPVDDPMLAAAALRRVVTHYLPASLRRHGAMATAIDPH